MSYQDCLPLPLTCQDCGYENDALLPETPYDRVHRVVKYRKVCDECGGHNLVMVIPKEVWQDLIVPDEEVSHSTL